MWDCTRTQMLLGVAACERLAQCHVMVFGVGGVGGIAVEMLARAGVGNFTLVDGDAVEPTNLNRQLVAANSTLGRMKVQVMAERIGDINPAAQVQVLPKFYVPTEGEQYPWATCDAVVDAIDEVPAKVDLLLRAAAAKVQVIVTSGGAARRLNPTAFMVKPLAKTEGDALARAVRQALRKRCVELGVEFPAADCVFSCEQPQVEAMGSLATVVTAAGVLLAHTVVMKLLKGKQ